VFARAGEDDETSVIHKKKAQDLKVESKIERDKEKKNHKNNTH
jgi:hypothetical protein